MKLHGMGNINFNCFKERIPNLTVKIAFPRRVRNGIFVGHQDKRFRTLGSFPLPPWVI